MEVGGPLDFIVNQSKLETLDFDFRLDNIYLDYTRDVGTIPHL